MYIQKIEIKELAAQLAHETASISNMVIKTQGAKPMDRQNWAFIHLGWIGMMKMSGYSDGECNAVIDETKKILNNLYK